VDFRDAPEEAAFRARIRTWLADNNPRLSYGTDEYWAAMPAWHAALYDAGFFGIGWPVEHGGVDLPPIYNVIVDEELAFAGAPARPIVGYLAHGLLGHGSDELQRRYIPGLVSGRERWCQGFSEPDSVHRDDLIGEEGEGWSIAMTIVTSEREPHELGWAARYSATVNQLLDIARSDPARLDPDDRRSLAWALVEADMLTRHVPRRIAERAEGIAGGPIGSVDKLLMATTEQTVGHAALAVGGAPHDGADPSLFHTYVYSRAASVLGGTNQIQRNLIARRVLGLPSAD
jgi:alkylation response protein AidB-like acyl-CoA dehydrogenase